jgi:RimJ/RimL family protein N-acetyltransferase
LENEMINELKAKEVDLARGLFGEMAFHLGLGAALDGAGPGRVYVDDAAAPKSAFVRGGRRFYLAGTANNASFNADLRRLFCEQIYPQGLQAGDVEFVVYYDSPDWETAIPEILQERPPMRFMRQYYEHKGPGQDWHPSQDGRTLVFPGLAVRPVDAGLLQDEHLKNLDDLKEEMVSECPTIEAFLQTQFGVCAVIEDEIAGWCLSEYTRGGRCEVGIETVEKFRKRGIGAILTGALVEEALKRGIQQIGWDCFASNTPSAATALKAGFEKVHDYAVYFAWFDEAANLAVNGNVRLWDDRFEEALAWYEKSIQTGKAPDWVQGMVEKARAGLRGSSGAD